MLNIFQRFNIFNIKGIFRNKSHSNNIEIKAINDGLQAAENNKNKGVKKAEIEELIIDKIANIDLYRLLYQRTIAVKTVSKSYLQNLIEQYNAYETNNIVKLEFTPTAQNKYNKITEDKVIALQIIGLFNNLYAQQGQLDYSNKDSLKQSIENLLMSDPAGDQIYSKAKLSLMAICTNILSALPVNRPPVASTFWQNIYKNVNKNYIAIEKLYAKQTDAAKNYLMEKEETIALQQKIANMADDVIFTPQDIEKLFTQHTVDNMANSLLGAASYSESTVLLLMLIRLESSFIDLANTDIGFICYNTDIYSAVYTYSIRCAINRAKTYLQEAPIGSQYTILSPIMLHWLGPYGHWTSGIVIIEKTAQDSYNISLKYQDPLIDNKKTSKKFCQAIKQITSKVFTNANVTIDETFQPFTYDYIQTDLASCGVLMKESLVDEVIKPDQASKKALINRDSDYHANLRKSDLNSYIDYINQNGGFLKKTLGRNCQALTAIEKGWLADPIFAGKQELLERFDDNGKKIAPWQQAEISYWKMAKVALIGISGFLIGAHIAAGITLGTMALLPSYIAFISIASVAITVGVTAFFGIASGAVGMGLAAKDNIDKFHQQLKQQGLDKKDFKYITAITQEVKADKRQL